MSKDFLPHLNCLLLPKSNSKLEIVLIAIKWILAVHELNIEGMLPKLQSYRN